MTQPRATFAAERARLLFGCYRRGDANDPDTYVAAISAVLSLFDPNIIREATDPRTGIQASEKFMSFMPNAGELKHFCDGIAARRARPEAERRRLERQLAERDLPAIEGPRQTIEEARAEMRARGLPMAGGTGRDRPHRETPLSVMMKGALSQEEWDAIPNAPPAGEWERLQAKHRKTEP